MRTNSFENREVDASSMRGVERTLAVLRELNRKNGASVTVLAKATGISRPALYRILETLATLGYIGRRPDSDRYELTSLVRALSDGYREEDWVREVALPRLAAVQQEIIWPVDLATFHDNAMYLRESTRRASPLTIDGLFVGNRVPMLHSATGRAYLAYCSGAERDAILEGLCTSRCPEDSQAHDKRFVKALLSKTRAQGYGEREEGLFPRTSAIAVPIRAGVRVLACLNITFIASVLKPGEAAERYLSLLQNAAEQIGELAHARVKDETRDVA